MHLTKARQGIDTHFYRAIRKYGADNFEWEIICTAHSKQQLNELETYYIQKYNSIEGGYNMVDGGDNNIMDIESVKTKHDQVMQSPEVRKKISESMKKYRAENPFTAEHRRKLSEKAIERERRLGHTPYTVKKSRTNKLMLKRGDTRSIGCYCIDSDGAQYSFHSLLEAGVWWYTKYKPFPYSATIYQRKIKQSIQCGYATYGRDKQIFTYPKWFKGGDADAKKVADTNSIRDVVQ